MWFLYTIIAVLGVSVLTLGFIIRNLLIQNSTYEDWIILLESRVNKVYGEMKQMDEREMFQSDDEVGVIFYDMKALIDDLNEKLGNGYDESSEEEDYTEEEGS